jgi:hypothetical protein
MTVEEGVFKATQFLRTVDGDIQNRKRLLADFLRSLVPKGMSEGTADSVFGIMYIRERWRGDSSIPYEEISLAEREYPDWI